MKVQKIDSRRVIIHTNPVFILIIGSLVFIAGLLIITFVSQRTTLECHRNNNTNSCILVHSSFLKTITKEIPVEKVGTAEVLERREREGGHTYKLIIHTEDEKLTLASGYSGDYETKSFNANKINHFINNKNEKHLYIEEDLTLFGLLTGSIFAIAGLAIMLLAYKTSIDIDGKTGMLMIIKKNIIHKRFDTNRLENIEEAIIEKHRMQRAITYRVAIKLKNGEIKPIEMLHTAGYQNRKKLVDTINLYIKSFKSNFLE